MPCVKHGHRRYRSDTCGLSTPHFQPSNYCVSELLSLVNSGIRGPTLQQRPDIALRPVRSKVPVHQWQSAVSLAWHGRPHSDTSPLPIHSRVTGEGFVYLSVCLSVTQVHYRFMHESQVRDLFTCLSVCLSVCLSDPTVTEVHYRFLHESQVRGLFTCLPVRLSVCLSICA